MATILIVDDHPAMRMVLRAQLAQRFGDARIHEAGTGRQALAATRQLLPDLVILDLDLPQIGGLELAPRLRAVHPAVRILVVSGQDPALFATRASRAGAQGYVSKTQELDEILRCVESVLAGYSVFPADGQPSGTRPGGAEADRLASLSDRELAVLGMLAHGQSNKAIAAALFVSNKTVSSYKSRIMAKLGARTLVELIDFARRCRLAP
jgi:two-component system response regulator EvgA